MECNAIIHIGESFIKHLFILTNTRCLRVTMVIDVLIN